MHVSTVSTTRATVLLVTPTATEGPVELAVPLSSALSVVVFGAITAPAVLFCGHADEHGSAGQNTVKTSKPSQRLVNSWCTRCSHNQHAWLSIATSPTECTTKQQCDHTMLVNTTHLGPRRRW